MNEETKKPRKPRTAPANVDEIIQKFLDRADDYAEEDDVDPKLLCALGWLVVKMKAAQTKAAATGQPLSKCVTEETINEVERNARDL